MIVHLWATDRMWEGLVGPSDEAWAAGVDALANARKASGGAFLTATSPSDAEDMEAELEEVVGQAIAAQTPEARTAAYGRLLSTCNSCHKQRGTQVEG